MITPSSWLVGSQPQTTQNFRVGLLTPLFVELAKEHREDEAYYETRQHLTDLQHQLGQALRGEQACAHGIDFCVWDPQTQQWFGTCKKEY